ncbi:pitrilysin family protein [Anaerolineales bacterium]
MAEFAIPYSGNITRVVLDNGIVVLVYENHYVHSVVVQGSLKAGHILEKEWGRGIASMTASMLMRGTKNRDFDQIHSDLEDIGAQLGFQGGQRSVSFGGKALAEDFDTLLDNLQDVLLNPTFPDKEVARYKGELSTALQHKEQDTAYQAQRAFYQAMYPADYPMHYQTSGSSETVPTIEPEELRDFHSQIYGPKGMIIAVVGAINSAEVIEKLKSRFENWQNPHQPDLPSYPDLEPLSGRKEVYIPIPGKTQSNIMLGYRGIYRQHPDYISANLGNNILGVFGMMGRVGDIIREELGLAYYAYTQLEATFGTGYWAMIAGVAPENVDLAIEKAEDEFRRIANEVVSEEELADTQSLYTGQLPLRLENSEGIATNLLAMEIFGLGLDYLVNYKDMIYAINPEKLQKIMGELVNERGLVIAVSGPPK